MGSLKSPDAYKEALSRAKADGDVKALLGTPIKEGYWIAGSLEVNGSSGSTDLAIPISGPKGSATLYVEARKVAGRWAYATLEVVAAGSGTRVDLRAEPGKQRI
jgi:hypothetical protein